MKINSKFQGIIQQGLNSLALGFSVKQISQIMQYIELLCKWNNAYNLVANAKPNEILHQHILDSLSVVPYIEGEKIIDVGTGAGLPGIPLAIALPEKQFTLLDSIGKKVRFLQQVTAELKLENVTIVESRAEAFLPESCFNIVVSRAVGATSDMMTLTQHLLCPDGKLLLMKGRDPKEELANIACRYEVLPLEVPGMNKERCLVVCYPTTMPS